MENLLKNVDMLTLIITIIIAIAGWIFSLWLQHRNIKHQHKVQIRYEIYKQFVALHKEMQDSISKLAAHAGSPFVQMSSSMIAFELGLKKEYKDQWVPWTEQECVFEGEKKWISFVQELYSLYFDFSNKYLKTLYVVEDWAAALEPILPTRDELAKEIERRKKHIQEQLEILQMYSTKYGHDWRKWDQEDIEKILENINGDALESGAYLRDFMVLIHNELIASYFGYKRLTRKTLDPKFKVLTNSGIVENVDWDMVKKMEGWKDQLISYAKEQIKKSDPPNGTITPEYNKFLNSVASGICPNCNTPILVLEGERDEDSFCFRYACGHAWKGIMFEETVKFKELFKIQTKRKGFGLVRKIVQGWKPSGDIRLKNGVDVYMDVNREKNEYHQVVKEHQAENILHEEHESLTEHRKAKK